MRTKEQQSYSSKCRWNKTTKEERFWKNVIKTEGCWFRIGSKKDRYDGNRHRIAWELTNGSIPDGLFVLHSCDNKRCTRPDHLFLGTQADNMKDMIRKNRHSKTHKVDQRGERNNGAKVSKESVRIAKEMLAAGHRQCDVMRATGISRANVWCIAHGVSWKNDPAK